MSSILKSLTCFNSPNKTRVGRDNDGGYVIIDGLEYDLIIGCGIANDCSFELAMAKLHPSVPCYAFDGTIDSLPAETDKIHFIKKNIAKDNTISTTNLSDLLTSAVHIFLKMDIDGSEYEWLNQLKDIDLYRFKQIVIEFHRPRRKKAAACFERLAATHYLVHLHPNNCCGTVKIDNTEIPRVFECTYVRKTCFKHPPPLNTDPIPSKLDHRNVLTNEDLQLKGPPFIHEK